VPLQACLDLPGWLIDSPLLALLFLWRFFFFTEMIGVSSMPLSCGPVAVGSGRAKAAWVTRNIAAVEASGSVGVKRLQPKFDGSGLVGELVVAFRTGDWPQIVFPIHCVRFQSAW
jgi:hypothetical protein